jgi:hypothetical protein
MLPIVIVGSRVEVHKRALRGARDNSALKLGRGGRQRGLGADQDHQELPTIGS